MKTYSKTEKQILTQLQRGIEISSHPFQTLEALEVLKQAQADGLVRRFGGVFDTRMLGYRSVLCALDAPGDRLEGKAAIVSALPGVTHCYERRALNCSLAGVIASGMAEGLPAAAGRSPAVPALQKSGYPSLWFTLAMHHEAFEAGWEDLRLDLETDGSTLYALQALKRFKIDAVFDLNAASKQNSFSACDISHDVSHRKFSEEEKGLVRAVDQQLPLVERPFATVAEWIGQSEEWVLTTLQHWKEQGILKRVGAILYHRQAGYKANAMCVWPVDENEMVEAGCQVAARPEVTHCYQRPRLDAFPFDLYAMIHTQSWETTGLLFNDISESCALSGGKLFASGREFKKSSMKYFR